MTKYKVSVIVSAYNSERFFQGCLENLVSQTLFKKNELEIVIINSNSQQNEHIIAKIFQNKYGADKIIHLKTGERETLYKAWNRGIELSSGKYLTYLNTDDRNRNDALEIISKALDNNPFVSLVYDDCFITDIPNQAFESALKDKKYYYPKYFAPSALLCFQFGIHPMWRKEIMNETGFFDPDYKAAGDYDFNIRFALKQKAMHIPETLGLYLLHKNSITQKDNSMQLENLQIYNKYVNFDIIENLYANEGYIAENNEDKQKILLDMGIRALKYYSPWMDKPVKNIDLSLKCFYKALEINNTSVSALNNLSIALINSGIKKEALKLLETVLQFEKNEVVEYNLELLKNNILENILEKLIIIPSGLKFPSQKQLSNRF